MGEKNALIHGRIREKGNSVFVWIQTNQPSSLWAQWAATLQTLPSPSYAELAAGASNPTHIAPQRLFAVINALSSYNQTLPIVKYAPEGSVWILYYPTERRAQCFWAPNDVTNSKYLKATSPPLTVAYKLFRLFEKYALDRRALNRCLIDLLW